MGHLNFGVNRRTKDTSNVFKAFNAVSQSSLSRFDLYDCNVYNKGVRSSRSGALVVNVAIGQLSLNKESKFDSLLKHELAEPEEKLLGGSWISFATFGSKLRSSSMISNAFIFKNYSNRWSWAWIIYAPSDQFLHKYVGLCPTVGALIQDLVLFVAAHHLHGYRFHRREGILLFLPKATQHLVVTQGLLYEMKGRACFFLVWEVFNSVHIRAFNSTLSIVMIAESIFTYLVFII